MVLQMAPAQRNPKSGISCGHWQNVDNIPRNDPDHRRDWQLQIRPVSAETALIDQYETMTTTLSK
jgi:hypothetical protein